MFKSLRLQAFLSEMILNIELSNLKLHYFLMGSIFYLNDSIKSNKLIKLIKY